MPFILQKHMLDHLFESHSSDLTNVPLISSLMIVKQISFTYNAKDMSYTKIDTKKKLGPEAAAGNVIFLLQPQLINTLRVC